MHLVSLVDFLILFTATHCCIGCIETICRDKVVGGIRKSDVLVHAFWKRGELEVEEEEKVKSSLTSYQ